MPSHFSNRYKGHLVQGAPWTELPADVCTACALMHSNATLLNKSSCKALAYACTVAERARMLQEPSHL